LFDDALVVAAQLDESYAQSGITAGALHGLPVSLKDCFQIEGLDATIGYTCHAFDPATKEDESEITRIMRQCGAVLFCKTNVPLAMMSGEVSHRFDLLSYTCILSTPTRCQAFLSRRSWAKTAHHCQSHYTVTEMSCRVADMSCRVADMSYRVTDMNCDDIDMSCAVET
jgi:hypothetical protein